MHSERLTLIMGKCLVCLLALSANEINVTTNNIWRYLTPGISQTELMMMVELVTETVNEEGNTITFLGPMTGLGSCALFVCEIKNGLIQETSIITSSSLYEDINRVSQWNTDEAEAAFKILKTTFTCFYGTPDVYQEGDLTLCVWHNCKMNSYTNPCTIHLAKMNDSSHTIVVRMMQG